MRRFDQDGSGSLDFDEFLALLAERMVNLPFFKISTITLTRVRKTQRPSSKRLSGFLTLMTQV